MRRAVEIMKKNETRLTKKDEDMLGNMTST